MAEMRARQHAQAMAAMSQAQSSGFTQQPATAVSATPQAGGVTQVTTATATATSVTSVGAVPPTQPTGPQPVQPTLPQQQPQTQQPAGSGDVPAATTQDASEGAEPPSGQEKEKDNSEQPPQLGRIVFY